MSESRLDPQEGDGHFEVLEADECRQLLREQGVGRIAFTGGSGLTVLPLAYVVDADRIVLRTASGTELAQLPPDTQVAFEVDEFDAELANGWSVLVRGRLHPVQAGELGGTGPTPFVPGARDLLFVLQDDTVTGRAVSVG